MHATSGQNSVSTPGNLSYSTITDSQFFAIREQPSLLLLVYVQATVKFLNIPKFCNILTKGKNKAFVLYRHSGSARYFSQLVA